MKKILYALVLFTLHSSLFASVAMAQDINFKAQITDMLPMSYSPQSGLTDFSFEMHGDTADVYLPYMGNAYTTTFGNDGLNFKGRCEEMRISSTKKHDGQELSFSMQHDNIFYRFNITLYDNNTITIFLQPSNAQCCSYRGFVRSAD